MSKLMSSLVAATMIGAFSMSAIAADAAMPDATATVEKPAGTPKKAKHVRKHAGKKEIKKTDAAAMPAEPAKK